MIMLGDLKASCISKKTFSNTRGQQSMNDYIITTHAFNQIENSHTNSLTLLTLVVTEITPQKNKNETKS